MLLWGWRFVDGMAAMDRRLSAEAGASMAAMDRRLSAGAGAAMGSTGMSAAMDARLSAEAAAHASGMPMSAMGGMGARSAVAASAMGIKNEHLSMVSNPHAAQPHHGHGGVPGQGGPGNLADYAGTAADSFAQAFVDR